MYEAVLVFHHVFYDQVQSLRLVIYNRDVDCRIGFLACLVHVVLTDFIENRVVILKVFAILWVQKCAYAPAVKT